MVALLFSASFAGAQLGQGREYRGIIRDAPETAQGGGGGGGGGGTTFLRPSVHVLAEDVSPYRVGNGEGWQVLLCSASVSADFILNLPPATGSGLFLMIKKMDSGAHIVAVTPNGADIIDGVNVPWQVVVQYGTVNVVDYAPGAWAVI